MPSTFAELDCGDGEVVQIERTPEGEYRFHGFELDVELAAQELGFKPSLCWFLWQTYDVKGSLEGAMSSLAEEGDTEAVAMLLELGEPPWDDALTAASERNHVDIIKLLVEAGADPYSGLANLLLSPSKAPEAALDLLFEYIKEPSDA